MTPDEFPVLIDAVLSNDADLLQFGLDFGLDPNVTDSDGMTPLHIAAYLGYLHLLPLLLAARGVNVNQQNNAGETPLICLIQHYDGTRTEDMLGYAKLLLSANASPTITDKQGNAPHDWALARDFQLILFPLLQYGADFWTDHKAQNSILRLSGDLSLPRTALWCFDQVQQQRQRKQEQKQRYLPPSCSSRKA